MGRKASGFSSFCLWFVIIAQITMPHHPNTNCLFKASQPYRSESLWSHYLFVSPWCTQDMQFLSHNARPSQHYNSQIPFSGYGEDAIASYGYNKLMLFCS